LSKPPPISKLSDGLRLGNLPDAHQIPGSGLAAGASKAGGVLIIGLVALGVAAPSIATTTLIGGIPMAIAALGIMLFGVETRKRRLEEITAEEFKVAAGVCGILKADDLVPVLRRLFAGLMLQRHKPPEPSR